jgi:hypothetical protein
MSLFLSGFETKRLASSRVPDKAADAGPGPGAESDYAAIDPSPGSPKKFGRVSIFLASGVKSEF